MQNKAFPPMLIRVSSTRTQEDSKSIPVVGSDSLEQLDVAHLFEEEISPDLEEIRKKGQLTIYDQYSTIIQALVEFCIASLYLRLGLVVCKSNLLG